MASLNDFQEQLDILSATKTSIKEAIIGKGQEVSSADSFSSYADKIDDIVTLEEGTADADAVASDIEIGKTAYVNGQKITGNIEKFKSIAGYASIFNGDITGIGNATSALLFSTKAYPKSIIPGECMRIYVNKSRIAAQQELTADKLKVGEEVLEITGTYTSDANATADDICVTKSAYVNGQKISGNIPIHPADTESGFSPSNVEYLPNGSGFLKYTAKCTDAVNLHGNYQVGAYISISSQASTVRNAVGLTADKLKAGESVLGITGTFTNDADATASDILYSKTAYVNGNKITGKMRAYLTGSSTAITDMIYFSDDVSDRRLRVTIKLKENNDGYVSSNFGLTQFMLYSEIQNKIRYLKAENIKDGVTILGITGNVVELNGETTSVTPTTSSQTIVPTGTGKNALTEVTVNAVTSAIDQNIVASNIKDGVTILGVTGTYSDAMKSYNSESAMNTDIDNISVGEVVKVEVSGVATYYIKDGTPVTYQPLDLSTLATGDTISLKGMKINNEATSNIITGTDDSKSITFSNNGQDVLELEFHGGAINISGSLTINGSTTYNYSGVVEGQNSVLSSEDVEAINSNAIWNSDDLLTITKSYTISSREIENAILEQVGGYSMVKLVKESETLSPTDFEEAEEQIGDLFGEEENN